MGCTQSKDKNKTSLPSRTQSKAEKDELKAKMDMQHRQLLHQQSQEESEEERKIKYTVADLILFL